MNKIAGKIKMTIERTEEEITDVFDKCMEAMNDGSKYPGMSYEDGIMAVLNWLDGSSDDNPFDE